MISLSTSLQKHLYFYSSTDCAYFFNRLFCHEICTPINYFKIEFVTHSLQWWLLAKAGSASIAHHHLLFSSHEWFQFQFDINHLMPQKLCIIFFCSGCSSCYFMFFGRATLRCFGRAVTSHKQGCESGPLARWPFLSGVWKTLVVENETKPFFFFFLNLVPDFIVIVGHLWRCNRSTIVIWRRRRLSWTVWFDHES